MKKYPYKTQRGFNVYFEGKFDDENENAVEIRVVQSSVAVCPYGVLIAQTVADIHKNCIRLDVEQAIKVRDALNLYIDHLECWCDGEGHVEELGNLQGYER